MSCFKTQEIPLMLLTRALRSQTTWRSNCELARGRSSQLHVVPTCVSTLFTQYKQRHGAMHLPVARHLSFLSLYMKGGRWFLSVSAHMRKVILDNLTPEELASRYFDVLSIILIAFPEEYSEILWEELRLQLDDALNTTIIPFLRVVNLSDVESYLSKHKRWVFVFYLKI
jgi:hypothetical protein